MAESTEQSAPIGATSVPPSAPFPDSGSPGTDPPPLMTLPVEPNDAVLRYRRAAPWIIAVFGLMGAVILLAVPAAALSEIEPSSRRTIVLASILAFLGVAVAIIASSIALAPRSSLARSMEARPSRVLKWVSARRAVEDAWAREDMAGSEKLDSEEARQRLFRFERERNAIRVGFVGVLLGAMAIGTAMGIMVWEFENPTTVFEIDRIHADTIRIQTEARRLAAETNRIEAEVAQISAATKLDEGELAVQADKLQLDLALLEESIAQTRADTARLNAEAESAPLIEVIVGQIADVELSIEEILAQLVELKIEVRTHSHTVAG
jgi:hypothetical protein